MRISNILVPVDFSRDSEDALNRAIELALEQGEETCSLTLLHVFPYMMDPAGLLDWNSELKSLTFRRVEKELEEWGQKVPKKIKKHLVIGKGPFENELRRVCLGLNIDLVVMSALGRHGILNMVHALPKETADLFAPCPVLVLQAQAGGVGSVA